LATIHANGPEETIERLAILAARAEGRTRLSSISEAGRSIDLADYLRRDQQGRRVKDIVDLMRRSRET